MYFKFFLIFTKIPNFNLKSTSKILIIYYDTQNSVENMIEIKRNKQYQYNNTYIKSMVF